MKSRVSIIIPVYNTEKFILKCIESCFNQTYRNIEIIAVDDGSTDSSFQILRELSQKDNRLILIHKSNEGVSRARYVGVEKAAGDYLYFLDSDDWLEESEINNLVKCADNEEADLVISGFYSHKKDQRIIDEKFTSGNISVQQFCLLFLKKELQGGLWAKLFRKSKWTIKSEDIDFSIRNNEDYLVLLHFVLSASRISLSENIGYNYLHRSDSASKLQKPSYAFDVIKVTHTIVILLKKQQFYWQIKDQLIQFCIEQLYFAITIYTHCYRAEKFEELFKLVKSRLRFVKNRKMYLILNSYRYGSIVLVFIVSSINFAKKQKSVILKFRHRVNSILIFKI